MTTKIMMKILIFSILLLLFLAACSPADNSDPALSRDLSQAYMQATQRAALQEARAATLEALSTKKASEAEIALLNARMEATQQSLSIAQTQTAATVQADNRQATLIAGQITATQAAVSSKATQGALDLAIQANTKKADRQARWADFWAAFWPVTSLVLAVILILSLVRWRDWKFEWLNRKHSVFNTTIGPLVFFPDGTIQMLERAYQQRPRPMIGDGDPVQFIGETTAVSPMRHKEPDTISDLAQRLLEMAVEHNPASNVIPGWREAGISSHSWQKVVNALVKIGAAVTEPGKGTYLRSYESASMLLADLQAGKVKLE